MFTSYFFYMQNSCLFPYNWPKSRKICFKLYLFFNLKVAVDHVVVDCNQLELEYCRQVSPQAT